MVCSVAEAVPGARVSIEFHDGKRQADVLGEGSATDSGPGSGRSEPVREAKPQASDPGRTRTRPRQKPTDRDKQGSLF